MSKQSYIFFFNFKTLNTRIICMGKILLFMIVLTFSPDPIYRKQQEIERELKANKRRSRGKIVKKRVCSLGGLSEHRLAQLDIVEFLSRFLQRERWLKMWRWRRKHLLPIPLRRRRKHLFPISLSILSCMVSSIHVSFVLYRLIDLTCFYLMGMLMLTGNLWVVDLIDQFWGLGLLSILGVRVYLGGNL